MLSLFGAVATQPAWQEETNGSTKNGVSHESWQQRESSANPGARRTGHVFGASTGSAYRKDCEDGTDHYNTANMHVCGLR
jgi:hypothetical protein